jgi:hypothetical protein
MPPVRRLAAILAAEEVLGTPTGLSPLKKEGAKKVDSTELS